MADEPRMTYEHAVELLGSALTFGIHPSLDSIRAMCDAMGRPQDTFASVQVTGTNGKSSVTRMVAAILHEHAVRVGCYTSPHLDEYTERIEIDRREISRDRFARAIVAAIDAAQRAEVAQPTEFEILTAAALWSFRDAGVDFTALEVGMGGRWDATSVVDPAVAVITGIALDHTAHLGTTREQIAEDKAQIIKPACTPVLGPGTLGVEPVFLARAEPYELHPRAVRPEGDDSPVAEELTIRYRIVSRHPGEIAVDVRGVHGEYRVRMPGPSYQAANAATAIATCEAALGRALDDAALGRALGDFTISARFEIVSREPFVVVDGSHNPQAAAVLAQAIEEELGAEKPVIVLGVLADKDARGIIEALASVAGSWAVAAPDSPRAFDAASLADLVTAATGAKPVVYDSVSDALHGAIQAGVGPVVAAGSLVTAAEARRAMRR